MDNNVLTELWYLRSQINKGIVDNMPELITEAKHRLYDLKQSGFFTNKTNVFISLNAGYYNDQQKQENKTQNLTKLFANLNNLYNKYVLGEKCNVSFGEEPKSIATIIWVVTAMADDVVRKAESPEYANKKRELLQILIIAQEALLTCVREANKTALYTNDEREFLSRFKDYLFHLRSTLFANEKFEQGLTYYGKIY